MDPTAFLDRYATGYRPYKAGNWCYEDGCIWRGLWLMHQASGDPVWHAHLLRLMASQVGADGALSGYDPDSFNIDNILPGRALLALADRPGHMAAAHRLAAQLERHPRIPAGNYWHKRRYPHQLWLDGLYMALPFQVEYGLATGQAARIGDALQQLSSALALTASGTGLHVHGYDDSRAQGWADPATGKSPAVWARAMGWLAMALVDVLAALPDHADTASLRENCAAILRALIARQHSSGLWSQVLDAPDLPGNYQESSASAMFAYALLASARHGLVAGDEAAEFRRAGLAALTGVRGRIAQAGGTALPGICRVAGLGQMAGVYRDGSPAYYLTEEIVADDAKGVGPLMMAEAEALYVRDHAR